MSSPPGLKRMLQNKRSEQREDDGKFEVNDMVDIQPSKFFHVLNISYFVTTVSCCESIIYSTHFFYKNYSVEEKQFAMEAVYTFWLKRYRKLKYSFFVLNFIFRTRYISLSNFCCDEFCFPFPKTLALLRNQAVCKTELTYYYSLGMLISFCQKAIFKGLASSVTIIVLRCLCVRVTLNADLHFPTPIDKFTEFIFILLNCFLCKYQFCMLLFTM